MTKSLTNNQWNKRTGVGKRYYDNIIGTMKSWTITTTLKKLNNISKYDKKDSEYSRKNHDYF